MMDLPRPEQVRKEISAMALLYGVVVAVLIIGAVVMRLGDMSSSVAPATWTMPGPY